MYGAAERNQFTKLCVLSFGAGTLKITLIFLTVPELTTENQRLIDVVNAVQEKTRLFRAPLKIQSAKQDEVQAKNVTAAYV